MMNSSSPWKYFTRSRCSGVSRDGSAAASNSRRWRQPVTTSSTLVSGRSMKRVPVSRANLGASVTQRSRYSPSLSRVEAPKDRAAISRQVALSGSSCVAGPDLPGVARKEQVERPGGPVDDAEAAGIAVGQPRVETRRTACKAGQGSCRHHGAPKSREAPRAAARRHAALCASLRPAIPSDHPARRNPARSA